MCNDRSILLLFKEIILRWVKVPDFWEGQVENRAKCRKMVIFPGLEQEFSRLFLTHQNTLFFTFPDQINPLKSRKAPKTLRKLFFGQISNSSLIFDLLPLPILGLSFKFYYVPCLVIIEVKLTKILFYAYPKLWRKNLRGIDLTPLV